MSTTLIHPRYLGVSLKMYFDLDETNRFVRAIARLSDLAEDSNVILFVVPDFISLLPSHEILKDTSLLLGAQDCFWEDTGPFTGEISPVNLAQAGVKIVILGHAERRLIQREINEEIVRKAAAVIRHDMTPMICIGEQQGSVEDCFYMSAAAIASAIDECVGQLQPILAGIPNEADILLKYEPVWAAGQSEHAPVDHVVAVVNALQDFSSGRKGSVKILYAGGAQPGTYAALASCVDGLFMARFGHDIENVEKLLLEMGS